MRYPPRLRFLPSDRNVDQSHHLVLEIVALGTRLIVLLVEPVAHWVEHEEGSYSYPTAKLQDSIEPVKSIDELCGW